MFGNDSNEYKFSVDSRLHIKFLVSGANFHCGQCFEEKKHLKKDSQVL